MTSRRFQSRRVFILHGLLLLAVLAVALISGRAQYATLRDQQIEDARVQQQSTARTTALLVEQNINLLLANSPAQPSAATSFPRSWVRFGAEMSRASGKAIDALPADAIPLENLVTRFPALLTATVPSIQVDGSDVAIAVPTFDRSTVRVMLLATDQLITDLVGSPLKSEGVSVYLGTDRGVIFAASDPALIGKSLDQLIPDQDTARQLQLLLAAGNVDTPVADLPPPYGLSLLTIQPVMPLPGVRWFLLVWRENQDQQIDQTLRPLAWQLVSSVSLMVLAVLVVLGSTTVSLYRGRRRIEQLRMDMLNRDLQKARSIQLNWLPAPVLHTPEYEVAAENQPAAHISGDFYNWFDLPKDAEHPNHRTAIVVGDVSGHGLPAAFLMATTQLIVKNTLPHLHDPGACLAELNRQLCSLAYQGQFVTILIMIIDHTAGTLSIASAGQSPPILRRQGKCEPIVLDPQLVAGVDASIDYETHQFNVRPGDMFVLYTDGVIETTNEAGTQFSLDGLVDTVANVPDEPQHAIHSILGALAAHRQGGEAEDDLTLVVLRLLAPSHPRVPLPGEPAV